MWAIMRATSIASWREDRVRARPSRTRCSARSAARSRRRARRARSRPGGRAPTAGSACRRASRRSRACTRVDAERAQQRAVHLDEVADGEQREVEPVRLAGRRDRPTTARSSPCSRRAGSRRSTWKRSVSTTLPGPDERVPPDRRLGVAGQRVADVDDRVRRVAVASRRRSRRGARRAPDSSVRPSGQDEPLNHACAARR